MNPTVSLFLVDAPVTFLTEQGWTFGRIVSVEDNHVEVQDDARNVHRFNRHTRTDVDDPKSQLKFRAETAAPHLHPDGTPIEVGKSLSLTALNVDGITIFSWARVSEIDGETIIANLMGRDEIYLSKYTREQRTPSSYKWRIVGVMH